MLQAFGSALLFLSVFGVVGCSNLSSGRRSSLNNNYEAFTAGQQSRLEQELSAARREIDKLEQELQGRAEIQTLAEQRIENFRTENEKLHQELSAIALSNAANRGVTGAITPVAASAYVGFDLPKETANRLTELSKKYKGIEFDLLKRVCRLQSELTFLDGGDSLRPEARAALRDFAEILNDKQVSALNLQIVGYTGTGSISPELAAQHPTAWHLASHQAIAIEQFLEEQGVSPIRMGTVSYADKQPLVDGDDEASQRRNARVEIYILPPDPPAE